MAKGERHSAKAPVVVVALPFAYREGVDEYNGVMRFLRESGEEWNLRIIRHSFGVGLFRVIVFFKILRIITSSTSSTS